MRRVSALAAFAAVAMLATSTAQASPPTIERDYSNFAFYPAHDEYTYGPGVFCGAPGTPYGTAIRVDTERQRETIFADGSALVSGALTVTVSKVLWTGSTLSHGDVLASVDLNISGPGWGTVDADGAFHTTLLLGPSLIPVRGFDSSWHWVRQGHLFLTTGRVVVGPGLGTYGFEQQGGTSVDVCGLLGAWS